MPAWSRGKSAFQTGGGTVPSHRGGFEGEEKDTEEKESATRQLYRKKFSEGSIDDKEIEIDLPVRGGGFEIMGPPGMEEMVGQLQNMMESVNKKKTKKRRLTVKEAFKALTEEEAAKRIIETGYNELSKKEQVPWYCLFLHEFTGFFSLLLEALGGRLGSRSRR